MTKTKKLALCLGIGIPVVVAASTTGIVVATNRKQLPEIDPQIKVGTHVTQISHTPIRLGESFKVRLNSFEKGFAKISPNSKIIINGKSVPFEYEDDVTIVIKGNDVTNTDVSIDLDVVKTVSDMSVEWVKQPYEWSTLFPAYFTGENIKASDLKVTQTFGSGSDSETKEIKPGDYKIFKKVVDVDEYIDITEVMKGNGYNFTLEKDITKKKPRPTSMTFRITYDSYAYSNSFIFNALIGQKPTQIALDPEDVEKLLHVPVNKEGEKQIEYWYGCVTEPTASYYQSTMTETSRSGAEDAIFNNGILTPGTKTGSITFKITSNVDTSVVSPEYTVYIEDK